MRTGYLFVLVMMSAFLVACQQQESTPSSNMEQSETTTTVQPPVKPEKIESTTSEVVSKPVTEGSVQVSASVDKNVKAEEEASQETPSTEPSPVKQIADAPSVPAEAPVKVSEMAVNEMDKIPETVKPVIVEKASGDPVKGAKLAKGKCGGCHYLNKDRKKVGPTLMGIFNRAPAIDGIPFARWDAAALDAWLTKPKAVKPKTKMSFKGISEKAKRDNIIAYLKTL